LTAGTVRFATFGRRAFRWWVPRLLVPPRAYGFAGGDLARRGAAATFGARVRGRSGGRRARAGAAPALRAEPEIHPGAHRHTRASGRGTPLQPVRTRRALDRRTRDERPGRAVHDALRAT